MGVLREKGERIEEEREGLERNERNGRNEGDGSNEENGSNERDESNEGNERGTEEEARGSERTMEGWEKVALLRTSGEKGRSAREVEKGNGHGGWGVGGACHVQPSSPE